MSIYTIITEDGNGSTETTIELYYADDGALHIKPLWAKDLATGESCMPCSTARIVEWLNNMKDKP